MSSLPPSSTPPEGDDSALVSLPPAADVAPESAPVAAIAVESPAGDDAAATAESASGADAAATAESPASADTPADQAASPAAAVAQEDCGPQLKKLYPALFSNPPKPLKLRIQADIQARAPGRFTKPQL